MHGIIILRSNKVLILCNDQYLSTLEVYTVGSKQASKALRVSVVLSQIDTAKIKIKQEPRMSTENSFNLIIEFVNLIFFNFFSS